MSKQPKQLIEKQLQRELQKTLGGDREVLTPAGRIDLLTATQLIEIKEVKNWKSGIGQLVVYGHYYPSHHLRLHLFGSFHSSSLVTIQKHCEASKIVLTIADT